MHAPKASRLAFAGYAAGFGVLSLAHGDFALQWQPVPPGFPLRQGLAYASGAFLLAGGVGLLVERTAARAALALTAYQLIWVAVRGGNALSAPSSVGRWLGFSEALALLIGSLLLCAAPERPGEPPLLERIGSASGRRALRIAFGACCAVFGVSHFVYADFTAGMIPAWLPARLALAWFTGACHLAAGLALLSSILARLAARLEALMLGSIVLLVHVPSLVASPPMAWAPSGQLQWTALFQALGVAASAAIVATSLREGARDA